MPTQALVLGPGDSVAATSEEPSGMRFLLVAGRPIGEPIVQHGPFVMNTQARRGLVERYITSDAGPCLQ